MGKSKDGRLSLERIQELTREESGDGSAQPIPPPRRRRPGAIVVWRNAHIADGIELHIEPQRARAIARAFARLEPGNT